MPVLLDPFVSIAKGRERGKAGGGTQPSLPLGRVPGSQAWEAEALTRSVLFPDEDTDA